MEIKQQMEWRYIQKWNEDTPQNGMEIYKKNQSRMQSSYIYKEKKTVQVKWFTK